MLDRRGKVMSQPDRQWNILIIQSFDYLLGRHRMGVRPGFACKGDALRSILYMRLKGHVSRKSS